MQEIVKRAPKPKTLAKRVEALEAELAELKSYVEAIQSSSVAGPGPDDWQKTVGRFKDDPTFDEAIELGRKWRQRANRRKW